MFVAYYPLKKKSMLYRPNPTTKQHEKYTCNFLLFIDNEHLSLLNMELTKLQNRNTEDKVFVVVAMDEKKKQHLIIKSDDIRKWWMLFLMSNLNLKITLQ